MPYEFVDPPRGLSYAAPAVDFGIIGNLGNTYRQAQDQARQAAVADAFKDQPLPLDPQTGLPDYGKIMQVLASKGGIDAITRLAPAATEQALIGQAGRISPLLGGPTSPALPAGGQTAAAPPTAVPPGSAVPQSLPAPSASATAGYTPMQNAPNSVANIVQTALPPDKAGPVIANMAKSLGVTPEAPLTPEQEQTLIRRIGAYAARVGISPAPAASAGPGQGAPGTATPDQMADARRRLAAGMAPAGDRIAAGFDAAGAPSARAQATPADTSQVPPTAGGRITPAEPLSPGFKDWQQNVTALEAEASRRARFNPTEAKALLDKAQRIRDSYTPIKLGQYDTYVDPATGRTVAQGPMAKILSAGGAGGPGGATLDADAERYRQTGTLPPNMGRGIQGQAEAAAIRTRAAEHEIAAGGDPSTWPTRWQEYRARGVGLSTGERVRASREENLNLILKVADAAIPAALEQSEKVWRTGFVPLNRIIQGGQIMTSDPELRSFGMANLQLAESWARAMNPTGVMRESDREKALSFLSTADSPATYRRLVNQLKVQITRERDSIKSGEPLRQGDSAPAPGVSASSDRGGSVVRWERAPDGSLRQAQ